MGRVTVVIDRRTFLANVGCVAASAPLTNAAYAAFSSSAPTPALIARAGHYRSAAGAKIETLHQLSAQHPGFAYFAGLPGNLGLAFPSLMQWFATHEARAIWSDLQNRCDVTCFIVGSTPAEIDITAHGPWAAVSRALDAAASSHRRESAAAIVPHGATLALTMPRSNWVQLDGDERSALAVDAERLANAHAAIRPTAAQATSAVINRVAEAIVAELSHHDALTRRINAHYFAFKAALGEMRSKNVV